MEGMGRSLGEDELQLATQDSEIHRQFLQCMLAEAVDKGEHWILENDLPSPDRE
jgi:hypothetical protein